MRGTALVCHFAHMARQALVTLFAYGGLTNGEVGVFQWYMDDVESEAKFDHLMSVKTIAVHGNSLTRLPSLKNLWKMESLWISKNKITQIPQGAFKGASQLLHVELSNNRITSVAIGAFKDLARLNVLLNGFAPTVSDVDDTPWQEVFGDGTCVTVLSALHTNLCRGLLAC